MSVDERYTRYRRLRINKHWDTARALFLELAEEVAATDGPHSERVHEIWMQLALNAYVPKRYDEAYFWLEKLRADYEGDYPDGVNDHLLYKYRARILAKFDRLDDALTNLDKAYRSQRSRLEARAEFLEDHGRYADALAIYDELFYPAKKKRWRYTWLLYKTGDFAQAHEQFMHLASISGGRRQAKYLYWAARARERDGKLREAKTLFERVSEEHTTTYYGIQARNRLDDIARRKTLDTTLMVQTDRVTRSADVALNTLERAMARAETTSDAVITQSFMSRTTEDDPRMRPRRANLEPREQLPTLFTPTMCPAAEEAPLSLSCAIARASGLPTGIQPSEVLVTPDSEAPPTLSEPRLNEALSPTAHTHIPVEETTPRVKLISKDNRRDRVLWSTPARIFWEGRDRSELAFVRYDEGEAIGPMPDRDIYAYGAPNEQTDLDRAIAEAGDLFPRLVRAKWLHDIGLNKQARWEARDVAMEYRALARRSLPTTAPYQLNAKRMTPLIDNRRRPKATWGYVAEDWRWPVPTDTRGAEQLLERQRSIIASSSKLRPLIIDALKEVGDYYIVRKMTLERRLRGADDLRQAYPRAFPELVVPAARKRGVNPYLIWALMTVESAYNPDSVSVAEALGLLQVIPRTGLKTAELLGEEDFGHYDLLDEDVAIRHGVFYFSRLVDKFHGQELFAIAGYNGGPHRVAEWIDQRGDMPMDEFVEEIPFDQARGYTKKVTRFLHLFLRLYEGEDELYIGQRIDRTWHTMPNF